MHWTINGRFVTQPFTGVQRYAHEIIRALDSLASEGHPLTDKLSLELVIPRTAQVLPELNAIIMRRMGKGSGHGWEQACLPCAVGDGLLSLCNSGSLAIKRQIVCIHDVNTRLFPNSYSFAFRTLYRTLQPVLGQRARRITTVSHYSAGQLAAYGIAPLRKILVAPNGVEHALRWSPDYTKRVQCVAKPDTIFILGSPAPHKNIGVLLGLADQLGESGLKIAVAGPSDGRVFQSMLEGQTARNVHWLGRLTDNEIAAILSHCLCLAFPSFVEGFGLPAIEAMIWGCPVIASDRTSLPEIGSDAVLYASPEDPEMWLRQILRLHHDKTLRDGMIAAGRLRAETYSWRETAKLYLQAMSDID